LDCRITPDAVLFDHDVICDQSNSLPHTLPSDEVFIQNMKKLKIPVDSDIVCYDA
jgi:thiosulfate/3-mercaptopyruvate sulfurtransferase